MSSVFGVPTDAAYHLVAGLAAILTPLLGGLAAAAAIVLITMAVRLLLLPLSRRAWRGMQAQARMAPRVRALRDRYGQQPARLRQELAALQASEGAGMLAGFLPLLLQWPVLSVMYLLFRSQEIAGVRNSLLSHDLLGAPLGSHWLGGAGPVSPQGAVFAGLFVLLGVLCWLSARMARRRGQAGSGAEGGSPASPAVARRHGGRSPARAPGRPVKPDAGLPLPAAVAGLLPYLTVAIAAVVPLAAGLYLATTTAWTLAERALLH